MKLSKLKQQFSFPEDVVYLNTASFSPAFKSVETAGVEAVKAKSRPDFISASNMFEPVKELRTLFAQIIDCDDYRRIVTIPSVSYGLATVAKNIKLKKNDEILVIDEQFPSNVYIWQRLAQKYNVKLVTIKAPENKSDWNNHILQAINKNTALVAMGQIHWANGIHFNLKDIRTKTKQHNSLLIIDGSQSVGALPFSVKTIEPDALICAGYKWLFGPYGCAYAYYGDYFDNGKPIEENWANRLGSQDFSKLTDYQSDYEPLSSRYAMGQSGSFIYVQMQITALKEVLKINAHDLQDYCHKISANALNQLSKVGFHSDASEYRAKHMFGLKIPERVDLEKLKQNLKDANIHVSFRGKYIRISCHVFNTESHFKQLAQVLSDSL